MLFRRAISKKDAIKLQSLKESFIAGCLANGKERGLAEKVYALIYKFADYGFNKSHAVPYAVLTCQMAYLKKHYSKEFYCAILDSMSPEDRKFKDTMSEVKALSLHLAVPDVNLSENGFSVDASSLRFPLSAIKGLQSAFVSSLLDERKMNGKFMDLYDFAARMKKDGLSLPVLVKLIDAGALDSLYPSRATLRNSASYAMNYAEMMVGSSGQEALLNLHMEKPRMLASPDDLRSNLDAEYEALGMMVSGSPLSFYEDRIEQEHLTRLGALEETSDEVETVGIVKSIRAIVTRKGSQMAFLDLYDEVSEVSFVLFQEAYSQAYPFLKTDSLVIVKCHKDFRKMDSYIVTGARKLGD